MIIHICLLSLFLGGILADVQCNLSSDCLCYLENDSIKYSCPRDAEDFHIEVHSGEGVEVNCLDGHLRSWKDSNIPNIEAGDVEVLKLLYCPLPNFATFTQQLGITSTKSIEASSLADNALSVNNFNSLDNGDNFEGFNNLQKLSMPNCRITSIEEDTFSNLRALTVLELEINALGWVEPNTFRNLEHLKKLNLAANNLTNLSETLFENLHELEVLNLWRNSLSNLPSRTFSSLRNLILLELSFNKIEVLPEDLFDGLSSLNRLSLQGNKLQEIPERVFASLISLEMIKLSDNPITNLPSSLFDNLTNLKEFEMEHCGLTTLPDALFRGSPNLENITLSNNKFQVISDEWFRSLKNLRKLDLSSNNIQKLSAGNFEGPTGLKVLMLQNNGLSDLGSRTFDKLRSLEQLYLNGNQLAALPNRIFSNLASLKEIYLANNYLEYPNSKPDIYDLQFLQRYVYFNTNFLLEVIDLRNNSISFLSEDLILNKIHLKKLDLSYNLINTLSISTLITASSIPKTVNLENNKITTVFFQVANLLGDFNESSSHNANAQTTVLLNHNPITCDCNIYDFTRYYSRTIDPVVPTLVNIKADDLFCASPANFAGFPIKNLQSKSIICSNDYLENVTCPQECLCEYRLWDKTLLVNCSDRNLTAAPVLFLPTEPLYEKTEVNLQHNLLKAAPTKNMGYENVTTLFMSYNNINELTWIPPHAKVLKVDANNLSYLSEDMVTKLNSSRLTDLSLGSNPWICDCNVIDFLQYLVSHPKVQIDVDRIYCRNEDILLTYYVCPTSQLNLYVLSAISIITILIMCLSVVLYYRNEHEIKVWLFAHNWCLWFVTEEEIDKDKLYDAFISYSHKDEDFVLNELQSVLEQGPNPYKLCLHIRDWIPGESISKQIVKSVEASRRTLVILSPHFLDSVWATMEFRTAHTQAMSEGRARVIIVLYGDIDVDASLDDELKAYIKTNTYVKWNDPWFWDKLRYALPHSQKRIDKKKSQKSQNLMINLNDKLGLINTVPSTPNPDSTPPAVNSDPLLIKKPFEFFKGVTTR